MKKITSLSLIAILVFFVSCQKASTDAGTATATSNLSPDPNVNHNLVNPPTNVSLTIVVTSPSVAPTVPTGQAFNGNFTVLAPDPINIFENQTISLVNNSRDVASYLWQIGDNFFSTKKSPSLSFPWHGNYHITLTVTDVNGRTATSSQDITILCNFMHNTF